MVNGFSKYLLLVALLVPVLGDGVVPERVQASVHVCENGITVNLFSPEEVLSHWTVRENGRLFLQHSAVGRVELLLGVDDPRNLRPDVTTYWPFETSEVIQACRDVHSVTPELEVAVFCLPYPPVLTQSSFARGGAILLAPGYAPVPATTVATICTHELGHVLTWAYPDPFPVRWRAYLVLRGLSAAASGPEVPHAERVREILAEDLRFLFGGDLATLSGSIENSSIPLPNLVPGLRTMLSEYCDGKPGPVAVKVTSRAYPNPCNPTTTIELTLPAGIGTGMAAGSALTVYDVRGRQIRRINGGVVANDRLAIQWDGRDGGGRLVASGKYHYRLTVGDLAATGSVLLVR